MKPKSYETLTTMTSVTALSSTVYAPAKGGYYPTCLTNGALTAGTGWTGANDFASSGNKAVYTHNTGAGTYQQAVGTLARTGKSGAKYAFTYTVSSPANTAPTIVISATSGFASTDTALTGLDTAGTYTVTFTAASTPTAFLLTGASTATGTVSLDDLALYEVVDHLADIRQCTRAVLTCEIASVNFTIDGTTPTITTGTYQGHLLNAGDVLTLNSIDEIKNFKCINAVASNGAVLKATYSFGS